MTSEPDSTMRRRPPTIDLKATEVETEKPASTAEAAASNPPGERAQEANAPGAGARWNFGDSITRLRSQAIVAYAMGASAGVIAMLVVFAVLWMAGLAPSRGSPPPNAAESAAAASDQIGARLDKIEAGLAGQRADAALATRVAAAEAEAKSLGDSLAALTRRVDDIAVTARDALGRANAASATGDLDALANRIAVLERTVKMLSDDVARRPASADDRAARMTVAAEALRAAVERGAPYEAELAAVKASGVAENALAPLEPFAAEGVPSAPALARELSTLTSALLRASGVTPSDGSFLGRLQANAERLVRVSPIDAPPGDDPGAVIARINAAATRVDIAAALAEIALLPDPARSLAEIWTKKAEAREKAIAASRRIAADALAALNRPASQ